MSEIISRREREKQQHREEILTAAEQIFAEKGFHRTTVEDVAERAEFAVGTLYNFFPSKEQLYQDLIQQRCQQLAEEANTALDLAQNSIEIIKAYVDIKVALCYKYELFVRLYSRERMGDRFANNELWYEIVSPLYEQVIDRLTEGFRLGIEKGEVRSDIDPVDMAIALDGLTDGFVYAWLEASDKISFQEKLETMKTLFIEGVRPH